MDIDDIPHPLYVAQIREFDTEIEARGFLQRNDGVLVPGKPWALIFAGVIDKTRCPIVGNHEEETDEFMQQAAKWLLSRG